MKVLLGTWHWLLRGAEAGRPCGAGGGCVRTPAGQAEWEWVQSWNGTGGCCWQTLQLQLLVMHSHGPCVVPQSVPAVTDAGRAERRRSPIPVRAEPGAPRLRVRLFKRGGDTPGPVFGAEILLLHPSSCGIQGPEDTLEICRNGQVARELELDLPEVERLPGHSQAVGGLLVGGKKEHPGRFPLIPPGS